MMGLLVGVVEVMDLQGKLGGCVYRGGHLTYLTKGEIFKKGSGLLRELGWNKEWAG